MEKTEEKEIDAGRDEQGLKEEVHTKIVRAGKRTYFFDVKATRKSDFYLTITESKKKIDKNGKLFYEKHKIFLYQEDFEKFMNGLTDAFSFIDSEVVDSVIAKEENDSIASVEYASVEFEDLGKK